MMQRGHIEAESIIHNYYNSSTKSKFYKNTRLASKIIEKTSLATMKKTFKRFLKLIGDSNCDCGWSIHILESSKVLK